MAGTEARPLPVITATLRLLTFCLSQEDFGHLGKKHLAFGFLCTWLVGIGRFWDHPNAKLFQYLDRAPTAEDGAEDVLLLLTAISQLLFIPLGLIYMAIIASKRFPSVPPPPPQKKKKQTPDEIEDQQ